MSKPTSDCFRGLTEMVLSARSGHCTFVKLSPLTEEHKLVEVTRDMAKESARRLITLYEKALTVLGEAESVFREIQDESERNILWRNYGKLVTLLPVDFRAPLVREYPELDASQPDEEENIRALSEEEQKAIRLLTSTQLAQTDRVLLENCAQGWRKVARVVGTTMIDIGHDFQGIPDACYGQRVAVLVSEGRIESQGNLDFMRFSEVRLPS